MIREIIEYREVIRFFDSIKLCAAFFEPSPLLQELVFIRNNAKFSIPIVYSEKDLECDLQNSVHLIVDFINGNDTHLMQRRSIMTDVICELTSKLPAQERFPTLLKKLKVIVEKVNTKYTLFMSGFSYQKIRDDIETAKIDFLGKINHTLSDIQTQLLGIPAEAIVVFTQMKKSEGFNDVFWANCAILMGAFFVTLLVFVLIKNQRYTLTNVGDEIARQSDKIEYEHSDVAIQFKPSFELLNTRRTSQNRTLIIIQFVVIGVFFAAVVYFYNLTPVFQEYINVVRAFF